MKYLKLFENAFTNTLNIIDSYNKIIKEFKPYVFRKYDKLVNDKYYEPEWGKKPHDSYDVMEIISADRGKNDSIEFQLVEHGSEGEIIGTYYIDLTKEDLEKIKLEQDTNKYNL